MAKRVPMSVLEFDKKIIEMANASNASDNSQTIAKVKKVMVEVIKNDLTARQKELIMLYYYKNMKVIEIAEQLNIDHSTVSRTLSRARKNIMERLKYYF
ncbi:MAG TPA: sigma-70 family RNA polymerase sigma factor [Clostridiales bacterium]|nr:sigma-70 family RNA polymerase sigma factor [Clostridiales bacterium]